MKVMIKVGSDAELSVYVQQTYNIRNLPLQIMDNLVISLCTSLSYPCLDFV
jgi:hypothetical protein